MSKRFLKFIRPAPFHIIVYVEVNLLLPDSPQQDLVFLLEQRVFREDLLFDLKAWKKIRIKVPKKVIMSTLNVGYAFQSKIPALQTSDGISLPPTGQARSIIAEEEDSNEGPGNRLLPPSPETWGRQWKVATTLASGGLKIVQKLAAAKARRLNRRWETSYYAP